MRYGIFSDVHSNLEALSSVIEAFKEEKIDKYFCLGDLVGYGVNPNECIEKVKSLAEVVVAGNHDWAAVGLFSLDKLNLLAREVIFWTREHLSQPNKEFLEGLKLTFKNEDFTLVHGSLNNPGEFNYITNGFIAWESFRLLLGNICFIGHTHLPGIFTKGVSEDMEYRQDNILEVQSKISYIVNVGSVGQPRDGNSESSYCIYDTEEKKVFIKRVKYNLDVARNKIIDSGLPRSLGDRLLMGM